jgi:hypothetical protein
MELNSAASFKLKPYLRRKHRARKCPRRQNHNLRPNPNEVHLLPKLIPPNSILHHAPQGIAEKNED